MHGLSEGLEFRVLSPTLPHLVLILVYLVAEAALLTDGHPRPAGGEQKGWMTPVVAPDSKSYM